MTQIIDREGRSTIASAEGQSALAAGDTERARERFAEAGALLEREMRAAQGGETGHLLRFLAATQFFQGGHYRKALEVASTIQSTSLPADTRHLLPRFFQDLQDRTSPDYEPRIRKRLQTLWNAKDYPGILKVLQDHPYVLSSVNLAFIRGVCCEILGKYRSAVLFFADAARWSQNDPAVLAALAPLPLNLPSQGRLQEAWEYVQVQLELFPNAVSSAVASLLCYHRGRQAAGSERANLFQEQARYFDRAREEYARLPPRHQSHPEIKAVLGLGYEAAAFALHQAGDEKAARQRCADAIAFDPVSPNVWTLQGILTFGTPEAAEAFKKAIDLGDRTYCSAYYLAYDALTRGSFQEALEWSQQAIQRGERQRPEVKSLLYQWWAISLANLGGPSEDVGFLFKRAVEIAPENEDARTNYQRFQAAERPEPPPLLVWGTDHHCPEQRSSNSTRKPSCFRRTGMRSRSRKDWQRWAHDRHLPPSDYNVPHEGEAAPCPRQR